MDERYSWLIRFERNDGNPDEEIYYDTETEAREEFKNFTEDDSAELYYSIDLVKVDWHERCEILLDCLTF